MQDCARCGGKRWVWVRGSDGEGEWDICTDCEKKGKLYERQNDDSGASGHRK